MKPNSMRCRKKKRKSRPQSVRAMTAAQIALLLLLIMVVGAAGHAADFTVQMTPQLTFDPNYLVILAGDTVIWTNADSSNPHDTTSTEGYWTSPSLNFGETYALTFPYTGTFPYEDSFYGSVGMTGTIVVNPVASPPLLTTPTFPRNNSFQFVVTNLVAGQTNIIQASTNLTAWIGIYTNVASGTAYTYEDSAALTSILTSSQRFYRVVVLP